MSRMNFTLLALLLIVLSGCSKTVTDDAETQPEALQEEVQQAEPEKAAAVSEPAPSRPAPAQQASSRTSRQAPVDVTEAIRADEPARQTEPPAPPPQQEPARSIAIPSGTSIQVRLQDRLDSSVNQSGDTFRAILDQDVELDGSLVAPRGSSLEGTLSNVARSGRTKGRATMSLRLTSIAIRGKSYPIQTEVLAFEAESTTKKDATKVGIGAGIGAVIGAIAGGGKGAAIGAAAGAGAGGATVLATRGDEVKFDPEQQFSFVLSESVAID